MKTGAHYNEHIHKYTKELLMAEMKNSIAGLHSSHQLSCGLNVFLPTSSSQAYLLYAYISSSHGQKMNLCLQRKPELWYFKACYVFCSEFSDK